MQIHRYAGAAWLKITNSREVLVAFGNLGIWDELEELFRASALGEADKEIVRADDADVSVQGISWG